MPGRRHRSEISIRHVIWTVYTSLNHLAANIDRSVRAVENPDVYGENLVFDIPRLQELGEHRAVSRICNIMRIIYDATSWEAAWISIEVFVVNERWMEAHRAEVLNEHLRHVEEADRAMDNVFEEDENPRPEE